MVLNKPKIKTFKQFVFKNVKHKILNKLNQFKIMSSVGCFIK